MTFTFYDLANDDKALPYLFFVILLWFLFKNGFLNWIKPVRVSYRKWKADKEYFNTFVDPETGVEYLIMSGGGVYPRLDKNGELIIHKEDEDE